MAIPGAMLIDECVRRHALREGVLLLEEIQGGDPALHEVVWREGPALFPGTHYRHLPIKMVNRLPEVTFRQLEARPESLKCRIRRVVADWLEALAERVRIG